MTKACTQSDVKEINKESTLRASVDQSTKKSNSRMFGFFLGIGLFILLNILPNPEFISPLGWDVLAVAALMLTWWVTEAVPLPVTALIPIVLYPTMGIMDIKPVTASYGNPIIFLFFGGFVIALAMEKWSLHLRIALSIVRKTGTNATGVIGGFMIATAFLSMWMSNTATTVMMLPIAVSVLELFKTNSNNKEHARFAIALLLGVAFAANIGGTATIIGTPPNAILASYFSDQYGYEISFLSWAMVGIPFVLVMLAVSWFLLVRLFGIHSLAKVEEASEMIEQRWRDLGRISWQEKMVFVVFVSAASLWIGKGLLGYILPVDKLSDTTIAVAAAILFFLIPSRTEKGKFLLDWEDTKKLPWGILLLFGGGVNLASAMNQSGIVELIGGQLSGFHQYGIFFLGLGVVLTVLFLTECMSNFALITIMIPVVALISLQFDMNPLILTIGATLASSCAFMLPMATPPNAIVFSSGYIRVKDMVRIGVVLNLIAVGMVVLLSNTLIPVIFDEPLEIFTSLK